MIIGMLKGVLSLYRAICGYVGTIIIPILLVIFHFQGRTLKNVKDDLLNDLKTLNSQYKMPATLSGKLNHFEKNYGRYTKAANDYCRLLVHCKKSQEIRNLFPNDIHVDVGGIGGNVPYILRSLGINTYIHEVYFNESPEDKSVYHDKRAEMYAYAKAWLKRGAHLPNDEAFLNELRMIKYNPNSPKFRLVEKDEIKKSLKHSPDIADAFSLTFPYEEDILSYSEPIRYVATTGLEDKIY